MLLKVLLDAVKKFIYLVKFLLVHLRLLRSLFLRLLLDNGPELLYLGILFSNCHVLDLNSVEGVG